MTTGTPPTRSMSVMTYSPNGLTSARCGTLAPIRLKSSRVRSTSASCGDGQQVQHGVGRAAEGHDDGDGVLERLLGHDVAGGDAAAQQLDDGLAGLAGEAVAAAVGGRRRGDCRAATCRSPRRRWPWCWRCTCRRRRPRRGRWPARWRRRPRAIIRPAAQAPTASKASMIVTVFSVPSVSLAMPGRIDPAYRKTLARSSRAAAMSMPGQRLVAAGEQHRAVEALGLHDGLDRVGDDLAATPGRSASPRGPSRCRRRREIVPNSSG